MPRVARETLAELEAARSSPPGHALAELVAARMRGETERLTERHAKAAARLEIAEAAATRERIVELERIAGDPSRWRAYLNAAGGAEP
jgi:biotin synthase-related radical SAM superfamily protein